MKTYTVKAMNACPSRNVNCWKVEFNRTPYYILPAHVAIHKKKGEPNWIFSKFLEVFKNLEWRVPNKFLLHSNPFYDFAWAKITDTTDALQGLETNITNPTDVEIYFQQPYDYKGDWQKNSSFASIDAVVYPSPESPLLEALDVGFRGLSGAIAVMKRNQTLLGMFIKRAESLGLKEDAALNKHIDSGNFYDEFSKYSNNNEDADNHLVMEVASQVSGEYQLTSPIPGSLQSEETKFLFDYLQHEFLNLSTQNSRMDKRFTHLEERFTHLEEKIDQLEKRVLKKKHLSEVLTIAALRRRLIIPYSRMNELIKDEADSTLVSDITKIN